MKCNILVVIDSKNKLVTYPTRIVKCEKNGFKTLYGFSYAAEDHLHAAHISSRDIFLVFQKSFTCIKMFEVKCLTLFCRYKNTITDCKIMRGFYDDIG